MRRKPIMVLCLLMVVVMLLSACGGNTETSDKTPEGDKPSVSDKTPDDKEPGKVAEEIPPDPFGKYENPVKVTVAVPSNIATTFPPGDSYENNVWTRSLKEELNIDVDVIWTAVAATENFNTKMNLAIVSNQLPDILNLPLYSQYDKLLNSDKLEDLTEAYEDYAYPLLKQYYEEDGGIQKSWGEVNGRMMAYSSGGINYQNGRMMYIRKDWFEDTGLSEPKTLEDFLEIAKAMKNQDPDNRFAIPLLSKIIGDTFCDIIGIANAVGAYPRMWLDDGAGGLKYGTIQPEMKKMLQIYADLFKEGMIDPAFASLDGGAVAEQLTSGKIGAIIGDYWIAGWPLNSLWDNEQVDWNIYPLLFSEDYSGPKKVQLSVPQATFVAVRKGYEHPEVLIKWLNFNLAKTKDPDRQETKKFHSDPEQPEYGFFGYNPIYVYPGPMRYNFDSNVNVTKAIDTKDMSHLKTPHDETIYTNTIKWFEALDEGRTPTGSEWASYKTWYGPNSGFGIMNSWFDNDSHLVSKLVGVQTPEMIRQWANLEKLEEQYITEIIAGIRPIDDFDKFVEDWRNLGGEVVEYEVNEWYKSTQN